MDVMKMDFRDGEFDAIVDKGKWIIVTYNGAVF